MKGVRRVITGLDAKGKTVLTSDAPAPIGQRVSETLGAWSAHIWDVAKIPPELSDDGAADPQITFPAPGRLVYRIVSFPPESAMRADKEEARKIYNNRPDRYPNLDFDAPDYMMHRSDTIDLVIVLSGEIWMGLKDADDVHLKTGDTLVQCGAVHSWHNRSDKPCVVAAFLVGTQKD
jgi:hypothetical protein